MLEAHGQSHVLQHYDELPGPLQVALLEQINAIDFGELDRLIEQYVRVRTEFHVPEHIEPPEIVPAVPKDPATEALHADARQRGGELIAAGKVAAFVVAGGQGTRLGY